MVVYRNNLIEHLWILDILEKKSANNQWTDASTTTVKSTESYMLLIFKTKVNFLGKGMIFL